VSVDEFGLGPGSVVVLEIVAVLSKAEPSGVLLFTVAWIFTVVELPAASVPSESEPVHGEPVLGLQLEPMQYVAPIVCDGIASVSDADCASDAPLFVTTIV